MQQPIGRSPLTDEQVALFIHIPKTAGSSLVNMLSKRFLNKFELAILSGDHERSHAEQHADFDFTPFEEMFVVAGHADFGLVRQVPQFVPFTFLRDPIAQAISNYKFMKRTNDRTNHKAYKRINDDQLTLAEFFSAPDMLDDYGNIQTKYLAGYIHSEKPDDLTEDELMDAALANLERCILVGLQERFDESILMLSYVFGWRVFRTVRRDNVSPYSTDPRSIDKHTLDVLKKAMALDIELHEAGMRHYNRTMQTMFADLRERGYNFLPEILLKDYRDAYPKSFFDDIILEQITFAIDATCEPAFCGWVEPEEVQQRP